MLKPSRILLSLIALVPISAGDPPPKPEKAEAKAEKKADKKIKKGTTSIVGFAQSSWSVGEAAGDCGLSLILDQAVTQSASVVITANISGRLAGLGTVTLPVQTIAIPLNILAIDNLVDEPDTVVTLTLGQPVGVALGALATAVVTVVDDDEPAASSAVFFTDAASVTANDHLPRLNEVMTVDPTQIGLTGAWLDSHFWQPVDGPIPLPIPLDFNGYYFNLSPINDGTALLSSELFNLSVATARANPGFVSFATAELNGAPAVAIRWSFFNSDPDTFLVIALDSPLATQPSLFVAHRNFDPRRLAVTIGESFQVLSSRPWKPGPGGLDVSSVVPGELWLGQAAPWASDPFARFVFVERGYDTESAAIPVTYALSGDQVADPIYGDVRGTNTTQPIPRPPENSLTGLGYSINGSTDTLEGIRHGTLSILPGGYVIGTPAQNQITLDDQIDPSLVGDDLIAYLGQVCEIVVHLNRPLNRPLELGLDWALNAAGGIPVVIPAGTTDQLVQIPLPSGGFAGDILWLQLSSSEIGVVDTEVDFVRVTVAAPIPN